MSLHLKTKSQTILNIDDMKEQKDSNTCIVCTQDSNLLCLSENLTNIAIHNKEAGLIISTAIAASIIIYSASKSVTEIFRLYNKVQN